jgi:dephospho-CoA kinase
MPNKPLLIGITGGIGSGKSTVCHIFEVLGVPVYYADERAKAIIQENLSVQKQLIEEFGKECFLNGVYNKAYISSIVFQFPNKLTQLNNIIHPAVALDFEAWVTKHANRHPYLVKEAALLLDSSQKGLLDKIFVATAPLELRIKRVLARDPHRTERDIKDVIARQMPEQEMVKLADGVIDNSGLVLLIPQVITLDQFFLNE